ncbi:31041_t:CDS:2, partial [Racocetra persica]
KCKIESARFVSTELETNGLLENIMRAYSLYFSMEQSLLNTSIKYYQNVSYSIIEPNGDYQYVKFCVGEIVETVLSNDRKSAFGMLEDLKKIDDLLGCPLYRLQHTSNNSWDRIHPISIVSRSPNILFAHNCKSRCSSQQHDVANHEYIRNDFFSQPSKES